MKILTKVALILTLINHINLKAIFFPWIEKTKPKISDFYKSAKNQRFESYLEQIRKGSSPGNDITLQAMANIFNISIDVTDQYLQKNKIYNPQKYYTQPKNLYPFLHPISIKISKLYNTYYNYDVYGKNSQKIYQATRPNSAPRISQYNTIIEALRENRFHERPKMIPTGPKMVFTGMGHTGIGFTGIYAIDIMNTHIKNPTIDCSKLLYQNPQNKQYLSGKLRELVADHIANNQHLRKKFEAIQKS